MRCCLVLMLNATFLSRRFYVICVITDTKENLACQTHPKTQNDWRVLVQGIPELESVNPKIYLLQQMLSETGGLADNNDSTHYTVFKSIPQTIIPPRQMNLMYEILQMCGGNNEEGSRERFGNAAPIIGTVKHTYEMSYFVYFGRYIKRGIPTNAILLRWAFFAHLKELWNEKSAVLSAQLQVPF